ncbi:hypothetical protein ILUMI_07979 [Ignelater luminosus]|uniref:Uncharacterized protein n=1 Tax=Ignelater luminosus TaxID=2038154 RepID=A0A8K0D6H1_IGNLU|nr:hypothetical protein ILUMI_07979 [Ignelater luminosus]
MLTMVDVEICSLLTNTHSQASYICQAKPYGMNDLGKAYGVDVKTYQARGLNKNIVATRKKKVAKRLRQELGILLDQPNPGYGPTNDENTARIFFRDPSLTSVITELHENLIRRFSAILKTLSSGFQIDCASIVPKKMSTSASYSEDKTSMSKTFTATYVIANDVDVSPSIRRRKCDKYRQLAKELKQDRLWRTCTSFKPGKGKKAGLWYSTTFFQFDITHIIFIHAFTRCDTTSAFLGHEKSKLYSLIKQHPHMKVEAEKFFEPQISRLNSEGKTTAHPGIVQVEDDDETFSGLEQDKAESRDEEDRKQLEGDIIDEPRPPKRRIDLLK